MNHFHSHHLPQPTPPIPMLFILAFLPTVVRVAWPEVSVFHPLLALGPLLAGFAMAARLDNTRLPVSSLGWLTAAVLWLTNVAMTAGGTCCMTINN